MLPVVETERITKLAEERCTYTERGMTKTSPTRSSWRAAEHCSLLQKPLKIIQPAPDPWKVWLNPNQNIPRQTSLFCGHYKDLYLEHLTSFSLMPHNTRNKALQSMGFLTQFHSVVITTHRRAEDFTFLPDSNDLEWEALLCLRHSTYLFSHIPSTSNLSPPSHLSQRCSSKVKHFYYISWSPEQSDIL